VRAPMVRFLFVARARTRVSPKPEGGGVWTLYTPGAPRGGAGRLPQGYAVGAAECGKHPRGGAVMEDEEIGCFPVAGLLRVGDNRGINILRVETEKNDLANDAERLVTGWLQHEQTQNGEHSSNCESRSGVRST